MLLTVILKTAVPVDVPAVKYVAQILTEPPDTVIVPVAFAFAPATGTVPNVVVRHTLNDDAVGVGVTGAEVGDVVGAVVGAVVGDVVVGADVGAVVGAAVGAVVGAVVGDGVGKI
jgi:hypothetical protein